MDHKRKPHSYHYSSKKSRQNSIEIGQRGFLCSCNFREKESVRESYNILNKYADLLYPNAVESSTNKQENDTKGDVIDDLAQEINQLKSENSSHKTRRFNSVESGARNIVFIRTSLENPVELAAKIMQDVHETQTQQTRYLIRLIPIEIICKAKLENILEVFPQLIAKYFSNEAKTFSINFSHRYNNDLKKEDAIKFVAELISNTEKGHKVNLTEPELTVIIEVIKGLALLSVVPDYFKYKKYNLLAISGSCEESDRKLTEDESKGEKDEPKGEKVKSKDEKIDSKDDKLDSKDGKLDSKEEEEISAEKSVLVDEKTVSVNENLETKKDN